MKINEMSDQEKSVMLARLCGWIKPASELIKANLWKFNSGGYHHLDGAYTKNPDWFYELNLYQLDDFVLAWRVLNWAMNGMHTDGLEVMSAWNRGNILALFYLGTKPDGAPLVELPPADAQRAWLDKILELAIEAGMVTK